MLVVYNSITALYCTVLYNSITAGSVTGDCESEERQRSVAPDCQDPAIRHGGTLHMSHSGPGVTSDFQFSM